MQTGTELLVPSREKRRPRRRGKRRGQLRRQHHERHADMTNCGQNDAGLKGTQELYLCLQSSDVIQEAERLNARGLFWGCPVPSPLDISLVLWSLSPASQNIPETRNPWKEPSIITPYPPKLIPSLPAAWSHWALSAAALQIQRNPSAELCWLIFKSSTFNLQPMKSCGYKVSSQQMGSLLSEGLNLPPGDPTSFGDNIWPINIKWSTASHMCVCP